MRIDSRANAVGYYARSCGAGWKKNKGSASLTQDVALGYYVQPLRG
jgi:hypothetical protein